MAFSLDVSGEGRSAVDVGAVTQGGLGGQTFYFGANPNAALVFGGSAGGGPLAPANLITTAKNYLPLILIGLLGVYAVKKLLKR
jgi:hypothetical protein